MKYSSFISLTFALALFLVFTITIFTHSASAMLETSSVIDIAKGEKLSFNGELIDYNSIWDKYKPIEITSWWNLPLIGEKKLEAYISQHDFSCGSSCESIYTIKQNEEKALIEDVRYFTINEDGSKTLQDVRSDAFYIQTGTKEETVNDYGYVCKDTGKISVNGTKITDCKYEVTGTHIVSNPIWTEYNVGDIRPAGTYIIRHTAEKKPERNVDWQIKLYGDWQDSWAEWTSADCSGVGGNVTIDGNYCVHTFTTNDKFNITSSLFQVQYLIVAGGGGGGNGVHITSAGGGGGAGGLLYGNVSTLDAGNYSIVIGTGGGAEANGINSSFAGINATGGGSGKGGNNNGQNGGSGGGAGSLGGTGGIGVVGQGNNGGTPSGGGGGANQSGFGDGAPGWAHGGNGSISNIRNSSNYTYYAGGGGGCSDTAGSIGGLGGGGNGGKSVFFACTNAIPNTGGGGGGGTSSTVSGLAGCSGGSGIVILRYPVGTRLITLNTPTDNSYSTGSVQYNCSATILSDAEMTNISLWDNSTGVWKINQTQTATGTSATKIFPQTYNQDKSILWNCQACDSDGVCGFALNNYTINIDATSPSINVISPTGSQFVTSLPYNITLNSTASDSHLQSCYYNSSFNSTTQSFTCNTTTTIYNVPTGSQTVYVYANDSAGNLNVTSASWSDAFIVNSQTYNTNAYETSQQDFSINVTYDTSTFNFNGYLVYNGTTYASTRTNIGTNTIFSKTINVPTTLNNNNQNVSFYWILNTSSYSYSTSLINQTLKIINFSLCDGSLTNKLLNFTIYDEQTNVQVTSTFGSLFNIWIGNGILKKSISFSNTSTIPASSYSFCTDYNSTIYADSDISYSATNYLPREYHTNNMSLNSNTTNIPLYLLNSSTGVKFYFTVVQGAGTYVTNANVQIDRWIVANGTYTANSIRETDGTGKFIEYLQQDAKYRFTVIKDLVLVGIIEKSATCTASPCEITLQLNAINPDNVLDYYNLKYSNNTISSLTFEPITKIVTYSFTDITGTAHYFRLQVNKLMNNLTKEVICDTTSYTTSGTLTCNMTMVTGDFYAVGYLSRSPEVIDRTLNFFIDILKSIQTSSYMLLFFIGWLVTITFAAVAVSRGNPSTVLMGFMIAWTSAKLFLFNPFGWIIVVLVDILIYWGMNEVGS